MKSNTKLILGIVGVVVFVVVLLIVGLVNMVSDNYNWTYNHTTKSDEPYNFRIFFNLLKEREGTKDMHEIDRMLKYEIDSLGDNPAYVYVDSRLLEHDDENKRLMQFVEQGHNALLCIDNLPYFFLDSLSGASLSYLSASRKTPHVSVSFTDNPEKKYRFSRRYRNDTIYERWSGIPLDIFEAELEPLGFEALATLDFHEDTIYKDKEIQNKPFAFTNYDDNDSISSVVCFFKYEYGEGTFFMHTAPMTLCNIYVAEEEGFMYVNKVLGDLGAETYYWDQYRYVPNEKGDRPKLQSPMKYIYSQKSLRWAMFAMLLGIIIYLLFGAKRKQKIMPVMEENRNSSIDYANAVSLLYYQTSNHAYIADEIARLFYLFIRHKYGINGTLDDKETIKLLAKKSNIKKSYIENINVHYRRVRYNEKPIAEDLAAYHKLIETFYHKAK